MQVKAKTKAVKVKPINLAPIPDKCAKCGKIKANHFFKTLHCAPHRTDLFEAAK